MEHTQEIKLSFIVPIYGVEKYLCKCVDSLLHQDYDNYEIVLVDDGGKDGCPAICDEYAAHYDNIRVIHRENAGLSAARNSGIDVAQGEYICFVDSDDYWEENVLGGLMAQIVRDNLDVLRFRWQNVREIKTENEGPRYEVFRPYKETNFADFSTEQLSGTDYLNQRMGIQCYAWSFILKRALLVSDDNVNDNDNMGCMFTEGILFEDTDWTPRMLAQAKRVAGTETIVYNYLWRENGITLGRSQEKLRQEVENKLTLICLFAEHGENNWYKMEISALTVSVIGILSSVLYKERNKFLKQLAQANVLPISLGGINKKTQRKARIINICPALAVWLLHIKNR